LFNLPVGFTEIENGKIYKVTGAKSVVRVCLPFLEKGSRPFLLPSCPYLTAPIRIVEFFIGPKITGMWVVFQTHILVI
jgi:hypothetical protein